jgi:ribonuclease HI
MKYQIFTDGGARGNPGPAAIGFVVKDESGKIIKKFSQRIGITTNNVAEYTAVIEALKWVNKNLPKKQKIDFFLDSKLVVYQLNGYYKIKDSKLRNLIIKTRQYEKEIGGDILYHFVIREKNQAADKLVNSCLA